MIETLLPRVVKILMATGSLEWDLPPTVQHRAGNTLSINFKITNPTADARQYKIYLALFHLGGSVIPGTPGPIIVQGQDTFTVTAYGELIISAALPILFSNCQMQAALYDIASDEMGVGLQVTLVEPPSLGEQLAPVTSALASIMALGMVMALGSEAVGVVGV